MNTHKRQSDNGAPDAEIQGKREKVFDERYMFNITEEPELGYEDVLQNICGEILFQGFTVGSLSAHLFERFQGDEEDGFYDLCDVPTAETQECSVLFFEDDGQLQRDFAHNLSATCNVGGYLHVMSVEVDESHRGQGLGLMLLKTTLDKLAGYWTIAMIQPYPLHAEDETFDDAVVGMSRHFARLGFKKCDMNGASERSKFWYLEACNYTGDILSKESVQNVQVVLPIKIPVASDLSKEIVAIISNEAGETLSTAGPAYDAPYSEEMFKQKISDVLARGGNLDESAALHIAVADSVHNHLLQPLVELGASINYADNHGITALHVAAGTFNSRGAATLLRLGADKRVKSKVGQTPVQMARASKKTLEKLVPFRNHHNTDMELVISVLK